MRYRVKGEIHSPEVAEAFVDAGLLNEYAPGYWCRMTTGVSLLTFTSPEGGRRMVDWMVPLLRDLGAVDVRVESKQEEEWRGVDTSIETL